MGGLVATPVVPTGLRAMAAAESGSGCGIGSIAEDSLKLYALDGHLSSNWSLPLGTVSMQWSQPPVSGAGLHSPRE